MLEEIRQRKVVQWSVAYLAAGWVSLQVLQYLVTTYNWSPAVTRIAPIVLVGGLLLTTVLAWYHGERGRQRPTVIEVAIITGIIIATAVGAKVVGSGEPRIRDTAEISSVAVMPFVDMSSDKQQEYFGDGITEEIINVLSQLPGLRVPGRSSSFAFKGKNVPIRDVAQQLNVANVLEGSVRKSGDHIRITAQLIDARTDRHIWSETYDRTLTDIFAVQDEIAHAIAQKLRLGIAEASLSADHQTSSVAAHEHYLKGLYYWNRRRNDEMPLALEEFKAAAREDPKYARAHAGIALTYAIIRQYSPFDREEAIRGGKAAARRALQLDRRAADAHAALSEIAQTMEWDWARALAHADTAVALDPNYATGHQWRAEALIFYSRYEEAVIEATRAIQLDPLNSPAVNIKALALGLAGRLPEAIAVLEPAVRRDPQFGPSVSNLIGMYLLSGRYDDALNINPAAQAMVEAARFPQNNKSALDNLNNLPRERNGTVLSVSYSLIGARDSALAVLSRGVATHEPSIETIAASIYFRSLRGDPRYQALLRKMNLPQKP